ncbi:MAG: 50S ribosomal protein L24 [Candidatus Liptonbacteria bacterium]|nr:50S ribosomal protein L24 [Candidatus Liptonbacteria bacterium]
MKIKKGDTVKILKGKDRGKTGVVLKAFPETAKVMVENVNLVKKRVRPTRARQKGQVVEIARPLFAGNVALVCASCKRAVRVGFRMEGARKVRYCRKCNAAT